MKSFSIFLATVLKRHGASRMVVLATSGIVFLSVVITSLALAAFQGFIDTLGIIISVVAPLLIFPLPAMMFFSTFVKLHQAEEELRAKNGELERALSEVRTLSGLLPICCGCKKIRDDQGYWNEVEQYFCDRLDLQLSHGFCPECLARLYPELAPAAESVPSKAH
jgi:hypothetical protein